MGDELAVIVAPGKTRRITGFTARDEMVPTHGHNANHVIPGLDVAGATTTGDVATTLV